MKKVGKKQYGRRVGDLAGGETQVILEIKTREGVYLVGYPNGTSLESIDALIKEGIESGLTLKLDEEKHLVLPAELVRNSVFIVRNGAPDAG